jgi:hypothetical protein
MSDPQHPAEVAELDTIFQALLNALSLLEKYEKRAVDHDGMITVRNAAVYLRDVWLDLSAVKRHQIIQAGLLRQFAAQHQSARDAYEQGWRDRLIDLITQFPGEEHAEVREALEKLL